MSEHCTAGHKILPKGRMRFVLLSAALMAGMLLFAGFSIAKTTYVITDNDLIYMVEGYSGDVNEAFVRAGITLGDQDSYEMREEEEVTYLSIIRTVTERYSTQEVIPFETFYVPNANLPLGTERVIQPGVNGLSETLMEVIKVTGQAPVERVVETSLIFPQHRLIEYGTAVALVEQSPLSVTSDVLVSVDQRAKTLTTASGRVLSYSDVLTCTATAYTTERQSWKITATGTTARVGAIAVDPRVIPYGTRMYIVSSDGTITYGEAVAEDCGGAIKGNKIDLFFNTYQECILFGRRPCTVYILK